MACPNGWAARLLPTPSVPWSAPDLRGYTSLLKTAEPSPIDQQKRYSLVELIDIAERVNPETRATWEAARQAAIGVGLVESEYFPVLTLSALGGYQSEAFPAPKDVAPSGFFRANLNQILPTLNLRWLLLDFGRRGNAWDAAKERLLAANLGFNRKHQQIIFNVQRAFLGLTSLRGKIARCAKRRRFRPRRPRVGGSAIAEWTSDYSGGLSRTAAGSAGRLRSGGRACDRTRCPGGAGGEYWHSS